MTFYLAFVIGHIRYIENFQQYEEGDEPNTPTGNQMYNNLQQDIDYVLGPPSTGSSSNAGGELNRKKVVINYADHVKQQLASGGISDHMDHDVAASDEAAEEEDQEDRSNISIGYNHAPTSPMRQLSQNNIDAPMTLPEWPASSKAETNMAARPSLLFREELEANDDTTGMAFDHQVPNDYLQGGNQAENQANLLAAPGTKRKFGKEDDQDSLVSGHSMSTLQKKANLELVWQKANSINGIRKMNQLFKEERRAVTALDANGIITREYWQVCETFIQMIEVKQSENLRMLTQNSDF